MSTSSIRGSGEDRCAAERACAATRVELEHDLGIRPNPRPIAKLWARRGSTDRVTEVGRPDPLHGGVVLAIFDMGRCRPFVVWWQPHGAAPAGLPETLGSHASAAAEVDA